MTPVKSILDRTLLANRKLEMGELTRTPSGPAPAKTVLDVWGAIGTLMALNGVTPPLTQQRRDDLPPLSFAQERLWSLERSAPGSACYHVPLAWNIHGKLNIPALGQSLDFLVQRHEALRTSFVDGPTGPVQRVTQWQLDLPVIEVASPSGFNPLEEALRQAREFARKPLDLSAGPLGRAVLFRCAPEEHLLVFVVHQINFDGASLRIFSRELAACYRALAAGVAPALGPLRIRYVDFAAWQRDCLKEDVLERALKFWRTQLEKPYEPLRLPTDYRRGNADSSPGSHLEVRLPKALIDGLKNVSRERGVTPFAALLGSWQAALGLCTAQKDVLTLVTVAARNQPELQNLVGLVANVLPMRLDLTGHPSLAQVLERAGEMVSAALAHQFLPLSRILESLPSLGRKDEAPALQVVVLYNNSPLPTLRFPEATFIPRSDVDDGTAKFDLLLDIADSREGVTGYLKYRADLFKPATVERLIQHWACFLEQSVAKPTQPIDTFALPSFPPNARSESEGLHRTGLETEVTCDGASQGRVPVFTLPRNQQEERLVRIWESVFGLHPIGIHDHFFALGGHSLVGIKLIAAIERESGQRVSLETVFREPTIARLAQVLQQHRAPAPSSLIEIQPRGSQPPVFLVHGAGGGMLWGYSNLARHLGTDQPVYSFCPPLDTLERYTRIEDLAALYVADLLRFQPCGPYHLGGFCFGGNIAYEMACQLVSQGQQVGRLFLLNSWPNHSSYTNVHWTPKLMTKAIGNFALRLRYQARWAIRHPHDSLRWYCAWAGRRLGAMLSPSAERHIDVSDFVDLSQQSERERQLWGNHVRAWLEYRPRPYPGQVVLLRSRGHPLRCSFDPRMGWGHLARGGVLVKTCPGDHATILGEEHAAETARQLQAELNPA